ncbi:hypothetical protein AAHE18_20G166800 [Arachis hypogaea]
MKITARVICICIWLCFVPNPQTQNLTLSFFLSRHFGGASRPATITDYCARSCACQWFLYSGFFSHILLSSFGGDNICTPTSKKTVKRLNRALLEKCTF